MWKKYTPNILWTLTAAGFLLLPVADARPFLALPLYPGDFICLALIIFLAVLMWPQKAFFKNAMSSSTLLAGTLLFAGALASWFFNGASLTGAGQLKSWLILPALTGCLLALFFRGDPKCRQNFLACLFAGLLSILVLSVFYAALGITTYDGRLEGPFTSPNFLAFFLFLGVLTSFYFFKKSVHTESKIFLGIALLFFIAALFATHSFGGWLAVLGASLWYMLRSPNTKKQWGRILAAAGVLAAAAGALEWMTNTKLHEILSERSALMSRFTIWTVAIKALQDAPLLGIGIGRFQEIYLRYQPLFPPYLEWAVPQPHNLFLALWLQYGLLGLFASLILIYQALAPRVDSKEERLLAALLVGMLVYGIFDTPLFGNALAFVWWTIFAFILFPQSGKE